MSTPSSRTLPNAAIILGVSLFALAGVSRIAPLRSLERQAVKIVAGAVEPGEMIIGGTGSQKKPWTRRNASPLVTPPPPLVLEIDDDPGGWFSTSPLAPVDHALIFARLREAGHRVLGVGHVMAWDDPEPLAMEALRTQLDKFDAAVLGLPLARGAAAEPVPAPFLRMSIADREVKGNPSSLPQVNRVAIPNAELGGERSMAGFSLLENEPDPGDGFQHLLARWGDRVLFAFPLATEIAALGLEPAEVEILAGREIRLGNRGPVLPIDEFGRTPVAMEARVLAIPAMRLISESNPVSPGEHPLLTRDARPDLPEAEKSWSARMVRLAYALRAAPKFNPPVALPRPDPMVEMLFVSLLAVFATWTAVLRGLAWRSVTAIGVIGLGVELLYLMADRRDLWLPPLAMLAPGLAGLGLALARENGAAERRLQSASVVPEPTSPATVAEETPVETALDSPAEASAPPPAKKTARKSATKAAKKTAKKAAKKTAKKAAKKTTRRSSTTPDEAAE